MSGPCSGDTACPSTHSVDGEAGARRSSCQNSITIAGAWGPGCTALCQTRPGVTCQTSRSAEADGNLLCQREPCGSLFPHHPQHRFFPFCSAKCQICSQPFSPCRWVFLTVPAPWGCGSGLELEFRTVLCLRSGACGLRGSLCLFSSLPLGLTK